VKRCFIKMNECSFQGNQDTDLWSKCIKTLFCSVKGCGAAQTVLNGGKTNQENRLTYPIGEGHCALNFGSNYSKLHCEGAIFSEEQRGWCITGVEYFKQFSKEPSMIPFKDPTSSPSTIMTTCSALECVKRCFIKMNECSFQGNQDTDLWSKCIKTLFCSVKGCGAAQTVLNGGKTNQENRLNYPIGEGYCLLDAGTDYSKLHCEGAILSEEQRGWCRAGAEYFKLILEPQTPASISLVPMTAATTTSAPKIFPPTVFTLTTSDPITFMSTTSPPTAFAPKTSSPTFPVQKKPASIKMLLLVILPLLPLLIVLGYLHRGFISRILCSKKVVNGKKTKNNERMKIVVYKPAEKHSKTGCEENV